MQLKKTIRIKVTGKCNRECVFCHEEGGMHEIDEIVFNEKLKDLIIKLKNDFLIERIALTGGEPLIHSNLLKLTSDINQETNINQISLTTNGIKEVSKEYWLKLKQRGLYKVNISISDILNDVKINANDSIIKNQIITIGQLNALNILVNINIVVFNDEHSTINILNHLIKLQNLDNFKFDIVLLPDLNNYKYSSSIIEKIICGLKLKKADSQNVKGTSNSIEKYLFNSKNEIYIKTTRLNGKLFMLSTSCDNCINKQECQEGFYGLRIECKNGNLYVRLCLHKDTDDVVIPFEKFINSVHYKELLKNWR